MSIMLITFQEIDEKTGKKETFISHGIDCDTGKNIITDNESLTVYKARGAYYDDAVGEWLLPNEDNK